MSDIKIFGNLILDIINKEKMKKLLYLFLATIIFGCSNSSTSNSNTLHLENNGMTLSFDKDGLKVTNQKGHYIHLDSVGVKIYAPKIYTGLDVLNSNGSKYLATISEYDYKNNRGLGGELRLFSNWQGQYSGLKIATNIETLYDNQGKISKSSNSKQNALGKACTECGGRGVYYSLPWEKYFNCVECKGTGRIFN